MLRPRGLSLIPRCRADSNGSQSQIVKIETEICQRRHGLQLYALDLCVRPDRNPYVRIGIERPVHPANDERVVLPVFKLPGKRRGVREAHSPERRRHSSVDHPQQRERTEDERRTLTQPQNALHGNVAALARSASGCDSFLVVELLISTGSETAILREARLAPERNTSTNEEYLELVCTSCASVLLTMERKELAEQLNAQAQN